ncbi:MAG: YggS family pyridoxal phosphate-dependent enzyme [Deltaproteobacteria bacterium]|nr:YggS family pyridoxal phosphate-dependent enzyme [Deltaproteobacteria bacterium]
MKAKIETIHRRIEKAAIAAGRKPAAVRLVAVSKTVPADRVREAIQNGITLMGENYIQEAREKIEALREFPVAWHFIGHLQSNKAKYAVRLFDLIHSVDSIKLARELNRQACKIDKIQDILIQVNTGKEASKSGVYVDDALTLVREAGQMNNIAVKGLMTLPPYFNAPDRVRPYFQALRALRDRIASESLPGIAMDELSMGMTGDFEAAIQEGATLVRIGTALFGERS